MVSVEHGTKTWPSPNLTNVEETELTNFLVDVYTKSWTWKIKGNK